MLLCNIKNDIVENKKQNDGGGGNCCIIKIDYEL